MGWEKGWVSENGCSQVFHAKEMFLLSMGKGGKESLSLCQQDCSCTGSVPARAVGTVPGEVLAAAQPSAAPGGSEPGLAAAAFPGLSPGAVGMQVPVVQGEGVHRQRLQQAPCCGG